MEIPEDLKYLTPYIQRGQELDNRESIVAYYAYYYAVKLAISRGPSNKTTNGYLSHLLDSLEQKKQALGADNEAITDDLVGYSHVENFALKVFMIADNEDRSGQASKKTAKTFLAASVLLELLKVFGELDPEVDGKIKYAKWKAADIVKAIREGRVPTPGAPGEQHDENIVGDTTLVQPTDSSASMNDPDIGNASLQPPPLPPAISDFPSPPSNFTAPLASSSPSKPANGMGNIPSPRTTETSPPSSPHSTSASSHELPDRDDTSSIPSDNANTSGPSPPLPPPSPHRNTSSSNPADTDDTSPPSSPPLPPPSSHTNVSSSTNPSVNDNMSTPPPPPSPHHNASSSNPSDNADTSLPSSPPLPPPSSHINVSSSTNPSVNDDMSTPPPPSSPYHNTPSSNPSDHVDTSSPSSPPLRPPSTHIHVSSSTNLSVNDDISTPPPPSLLPQSSQPLHHEQSTPPASQPPTQAGPSQIAAAQKNAKWAISALNYDDIKTARTQLLDALNELGYNTQNDFGY
ncbi:unnamed protein product [Absidia cylindrospora]